MTNAEPWLLGIDFGTSYTVAAQRLPGRNPEVIELGGERRMPSVVVIDEHGSTIVGRSAENLAGAQPTRAVRAPKSRLGDPSPIVLGGRAFRAVDLVSTQLRAVFDEATRTVGWPPSEVRLTHPAMWAGARLGQLLEAGALAGISNPALVPEPVAAAAAYAEAAAVAEGAIVAVYDLGGGTFDSAVLQATRGGFVIIGRPGGEDRLGGILFDELLANHLGDQLDPAVWEALQVSDELVWQQASAALRSEARKAKESLSSYPSADVLIGLPHGMVHLHVQRDELDRLTRPSLADTVDALQRTIDDAGIAAHDLAAIFLTGGASRMPLVEQMVIDAFPAVPVSRRGDPKTAVALGATHALAATSAPPRRGSNPPVAVATAPGHPAPADAGPSDTDPAFPDRPGTGQTGVGSDQLVAPHHPTAAVFLPSGGYASPPTAVGRPVGHDQGSGARLPATPAPLQRPRRSRLMVVLVVLLLVVVAVGAALLGRGLASRAPTDDLAAPTTDGSSRPGVDLTAPRASSPTSAPIAAPVTTVGTTAPPPTPTPTTAAVSVPPPPTNTIGPPGTTVPVGLTCPPTALTQNRSPGGSTPAVAEYVTADFVARICWTGAEYVYYGFERGDPATSVLIGALPTDTGWQATNGSVVYFVNASALVVHEGGAVILSQPVVSSRQFP